MISENINNKLKIFVSYPPGAGGQFMCLLIISLQNAISLIDKSSGHPQIPLINLGKDPGIQFSKDFLTHTATDVDINNSSKWLLENFKFYDIDRNYYTIHCYLKNLKVITETWPEAKIINILVDNSDLDQLYYNFVTKSMPTHNEWYLLKPWILRIREQYNKLHWVDINNMYKYHNDIKLCCYIMKFGRPSANPWTQQKISLERCYWIKFQDMFNKNLVGYIDELIDFLGIEVTAERKESTIQMINDYANAQKVVPWKLNLEDYD